MLPIRYIWGFHFEGFFFQVHRGGNHPWGRHQNSTDSSIQFLAVYLVLNNNNRPNPDEITGKHSSYQALFVTRLTNDVTWGSR